MLQPRIAVSTLLLALCLTGASRAQTPPDAKEILQKVRESYRSLNSYHFEYAVAGEDSYEGQGLSSESKRQERYNVWFAKPTKWRIEAQDPRTNIVKLADGQMVWTLLPGFKFYTRRPRAIAERLSHDYSREFAEEYQFNYLLNQSASLFGEYADLLNRGGNPQYRLAGEAKLALGGQTLNCYLIELSYPYSTRQLWIDQQRYIVVRDVSQAKGKNPQGMAYSTRRTVSFKIAQINESFPDDFFTYTAPEGAVEVYKLSLYDLPREALVGKLAPDFTLKDLAGKEVSLQALKGKVVLLNFWATWCGPCLAELPSLHKLQQEYQDIVFLLVDDEDAEKPREYLQKHNYSFTSLVDNQRKVADLYRVGGIPQTFIISKDGKLLTQMTGARGEKEFRALLEKARGGQLALASTRDAESEQRAALQDFLGSWQNSSAQGGIQRLRVQLLGGRLTVQAWECSEPACDWGAVEAQAFRAQRSSEISERPQVLQAQFGFGLLLKFITLYPEGSERLRAEVLFNNGDREHSRNYRAVVFLEREKARPPLAALPAPKLLAPAQDSVFNHYPRRTELHWEAVPGAAGYRIELDSGEPSSRLWLSERTGRSGWIVEAKTNSHTFNFVGAQPGRWRVWAVDANGQAGAKSEWWEFRYTK